MSALIAPVEAMATTERVPFTVIDQAVHLLDSAAESWGIQLEIALGPGALRSFAGHFEADFLALAGAGR